MRIKSSRVLQSLAFALATLMATGVLVAAGLNETAPGATAVTHAR
jgi:hypothetical protein